MSPADWLRERVHGAPPHLLGAMIEAVDGSEGAPLPDALAEAAVRVYRDVLGGAGGREDAFPLLVADALLTHAFEAQAERSAGDLAGFARRWGGAGRLGELLA